MNKANLNSALSKVFLNQSTESSIFEVKDDILFIKFSSDDRSIIGKVELKNFNMKDVTFGLYLQDFIKVINILEENDFEIDFINSDKDIVLKDKKFSINYRLSTPDIITNVYPKEIKIKDFEYEIDLTDSFIDDFVRAKNGLAKDINMSLKIDKDVIKVKIGTNEIFVVLDLKGTFEPHFDEIFFNPEYIKNILVNNKDKESAKLFISVTGIMKLQFENKNIVSEYLIPAMQQ
jgi:hypothetical protein